jgi:hypothetical protein
LYIFFRTENVHINPIVPSSSTSAILSRLRGDDKRSSSTATSRRNSRDESKHDDRERERERERKPVTSNILGLDEEKGRKSEGI